MNRKSVNPGKLGYYARARNLQRTSQKDCRKTMTVAFQRTQQKLATLPGIGPYTAGAVASFAFSEGCCDPNTNADAC